MQGNQFGAQDLMTVHQMPYIGPREVPACITAALFIHRRRVFLVPGLLDGHMHVESGMVTVTEFVRAVAPRGTTGMFVDPHEIANVFGLPGVHLMVDFHTRWHPLFMGARAYVERGELAAPVMAFLPRARPMASISRTTKPRRAISMQ